MGELSFSISNAVRLGDIAKYIAPDLYKAAQARVKKGIKQSGRIVIAPAQWRELCELEAKMADSDSTSVASGFFMKKNEHPKLPITGSAGQAKRPKSRS